MDSRGWIPIGLIASFNRVRTLVPDAGVVRDVLGLSSVLEVRDEWVRMGGDGWRGFVLPDAQRSVVEPEAEEVRPNGVSVVEDGEEEEEEDVEFVLGANADGTWAP